MFRSLTSLVKPRRMAPLIVGVVVFAAAVDADWLASAVAVLVALLVALPLATEVSKPMRSRFADTGPVGRLAAGAASAAASKWFALGALAVYAARQDSSHSFAGAGIVGVGAAALALATIALKPATRGDLRLNLDSVQRSRTLPWALSALSLAATLAVLALGTWPTALAKVAGALSSVLFLVGAFYVVRRIVRRSVYRERTRVRIEDIGARFAIHISGPPDSSYQLSTWLPLFAQLGERYIIMVREESLYAEICELTDQPVVYASSLSAMDDVLATGIGTVFYVNNAASNTHLVRRVQLHHVQLLHGDSDKPSSRNPVSAMYDELFVAGEAAIDRYWDHDILIAREKFRIVGRPQVGDISGPLPVTGPRTVLYAPTWNGFFNDANYSSLPYGAEIVQALLDQGATVIFREHPYTNKASELAHKVSDIHELLTADAAATGRQHRFGPAMFEEMTLVDCFNASDAAVTDISAVPIDYLFSAKPIAIMEMRPDILVRVEGRPTLAAASYMAQPEDDIDAWIARLLADADLSAEREAAREYYLGPFDHVGYAEHFVDALRDVICANEFEGELELED